MSSSLRLSASGRVELLSKGGLVGGCTPLAQGGIAAAIGPGDSDEAHCEDTVACGCGLTQEEPARIVAEFAPSAVGWLEKAGVGFDRDQDGRLHLGREGGHRRRRVVHAGGDSTGAAVAGALAATVRDCPRVVVRTHTFLLDLLTDAAGRVIGVSLKAGGQVEWLLARAVVLATGGFANAYATSTNPDSLTADGAAAALRAGAELSDLEFVQFHPTVLWTGGTGQLPLISEAVRGEGAYLIDATGKRYMSRAHSMAELAPRDVVARTTAMHMRRTEAAMVRLDGRHLGSDVWRHRFPTIRARCLDYGVDPVVEPIPVAPAAHYCCGGVTTDLAGRTTVAGLYACGEVARTGLHGANRLASNSLLEAVTFAHIVADCAAMEAMPTTDVAPAAVAPVISATVRAKLREMMLDGVGVLRSGAGISQALAALDAIGATSVVGSAGVADWETTNLHALAQAVVLSALCRTESRGCHYRSDFPATDNQGWRQAVTVRLDGTRLQVAPSMKPEDRR